MSQPNANQTTGTIPTTLADGRYTLQQALSQDGADHLYLAIDHEAFDRTVLIQILSGYFATPDHQAAQDTRIHFLETIKQVAAIKHPAVPQIFAYFQDGPHVYIVMEHIAGHSLEQNLTHVDSSGTLHPGQAYPLGQVLEWGIALCRLLEYLEQQQTPVVHANICPAHLLQDDQSGELRLVGFGGPGAGTPGYAAPEQTQGHITPAGDCYALAATLYHLATDDDPRAHPGDFPQLERCGPLGAVLRKALHSDPTQRSNATTLRQQLELLLKTGTIPTLEAPDGTPIADIPTLTRWCEQHWSQATAWLYGKLPDQIEVRWQQPTLAQDLRTIVHQYKNQDAGLDALLAQLDPQGYSTSSFLQIDPQIIDYGKIPANFSTTHTLHITNQGRRLSRIQIQAPNWIRPVGRTFTLRPGEGQCLKLSIEPLTAHPSRRRRANVTIYDGSTTQLVEVRAHITYWHTFRHFVNNNVWVLLILLPMLLCLGGTHISRINEQIIQEQRLTNHYQAGVTALEQQDWTLARREFLQVLALQNDYKDAETLLKESYYRAGTAALEQEDWPRARQEFTQVLTYQRDYKDAETLFKESFYRAGASALERQHWTLAQQEFEQVLILQRDYKDAETLLKESFYRAGTAALEQEDWTEARDLLQQAGDYQDAPALLAESYDRELQSALAAENWNNAALALAQLYAERGAYPEYADTIAQTPPLAQALTRLRTGAWQNGTVLLKHTRINNPGFVTFSPAGSHIAVRNANNVQIWLMHANEPEHEITNLPGISNPTFSHDGTMLAVTSLDNRISIFQINNGARIQAFTPLSDTLSSIALSPGGQQLSVGSADGTVTLWQVDSGELLWTRTGHSDTIQGTTFSPDGQMLAVFGRDGTVTLWRVQDGTLLQTLTGHSDWVSNVAFSPDGTLLASGGDDGRIILWQPGNDTPLLVHDEANQQVHSIVFHPDGQMLIAGYTSRKINFWRVNDGTLLHTYNRDMYTINNLAFLDDGLILAAGNDRGVITFLHAHLNLSPEE
jgi:serine/threonine protein kinase/tetratricopeptide (TPR) repeat protein